jgi:hypothetical protein
MMPSFTNLRRTILSCCLTLAVLATTVIVPLAAYAVADEDVVNPDARYEGYSPKIVLEGGGGTGGTVVFLILLIALTMGVMFINAKRSHLD